MATAVGGTPEVVDDGVNGFLVPSGEVRALTEGIRKLLLDAELRRQVAERGRQRVRDHFAFPAQANAYDMVLQGLVQKR